MKSKYVSRLTMAGAAFIVLLFFLCLPYLLGLLGIDPRLYVAGLGGQAKALVAGLPYLDPNISGFLLGLLAWPVAAWVEWRRRQSTIGICHDLVRSP